MYWDINKVLSYNCLYNFIVGARGVGKTYGAKRWAINDFIKNRAEFIYLRRYDTELENITKFFDDICKEFPEHKLTVKGKLFFIDGVYAGRAISLSTSRKEKSTPFPSVNKIIFDEFILDRGAHHYLSDEVTTFLEFYSTVARSRDVRVLFLSNALTITNPYFIYFRLNLPYGKDIVAKNDILLQCVKDAEYTEMMKNTRFGKIIAGTPYGDYNIENKFLRDDPVFLGKKSVTAHYVFTMVYQDHKIGIWTDYTQGLMYASADIDPSCKLVYSLTLSDHSPNMMLLKAHRSILFERFLKCYKTGVVRFENQQIKNICQEIIRLTL